MIAYADSVSFLRMWLHTHVLLMFVLVPSITFLGTKNNIDTLF